MSAADRYPVLFYDGHCALCNGIVRWLLKKDGQGVFKFASLQGALAAEHLGEPAGQDPASIVLMAEGGKVFTYSDAVLEVFRRLPFPYRILYVFRFVPHTLRNGVYRWIARRRYRWFGRYDACPLPEPRYRDRFL